MFNNWVRYLFLSTDDERDQFDRGAVSFSAADVAQCSMQLLLTTCYIRYSRSLSCCIIDNLAKQ